MRRLIRAAILVAVTLPLGVVFAMYWSRIFPKQVSMCMLAHNPAAYDGQVIRIEAVASVISAPISAPNFITIFEPSCAAEPDGWANIELDESYQPTADVEAFINNPTLEVRDARVVVVGRFDQSASPGCFGPRFGIKATSVALVSSVTSGPLPETPKEPKKLLH